MVVLIVQVAYFVGAILLNMFLLMIARFYKKKLDPKAISLGFVVAIFFIGIATAGVFVTNETTSKIVIFSSSTVAGIFSIWNSTLLYFSMKKIHK